MSTTFRRHMLAALDCPTEEQVRAHLDRGPLVLTPKYDGIRCRVKEGHVITGKKFKFVKNTHIAEALDSIVPDLDGELVCYDELNRMYDFNTTQSQVMSVGGFPRFKFHVFDCPDINDDYQGRVGWLFVNIPKLKLPCVEMAPVTWCFTYLEVQTCITNHLAQGFEGSIGRTLNSPYKEGRATLREGWAMKFKPFKDEEAKVIGYTPYYINNAEPEICAVTGLQGRKKRIEERTLVPGVFGALVCHNSRWGQFNVGTGFTDLQRCNVNQFLDRTITFKYQPNHSKDKPHAATFKCICEEEE